MDRIINSVFFQIGCLGFMIGLLEYYVDSVKLLMIGIILGLIIGSINYRINKLEELIKEIKSMSNNNINNNNQEDENG